MEKINFQNGVTKVNAETFTSFQENIESGINNAVKTNINTEETETNEYISGKRMYVKNIKVNASANTGGWEDIALGLTGNYTIQKVTGTVEHLNYKYYLPYYETADVYLILAAYQNSLKEKHGVIFNNAALDILVYYTKD